MKRYLCAAAITGLLLPGPAALAQSGTTSGPAAGSQATLGTGGQAPATPHQADSLKNGGGAAVRNEQQGQAGGTTAKAAKPGTEGGPAPATPK